MKPFEIKTFHKISRHFETFKQLTHFDIFRSKWHTFGTFVFYPKLLSGTLKKLNLWDKFFILPPHYFGSVKCFIHIFLFFAYFIGILFIFLILPSFFEHLLYKFSFLSIKKMKNTFIMILERISLLRYLSCLNIISFFSKFLNSIYKIIWKIISANNQIRKRYYYFKNNYPASVLYNTPFFINCSTTFFCSIDKSPTAQNSSSFKLEKESKKEISSDCLSVLTILKLSK